MVFNSRVRLASILFLGLLGEARAQGSLEDYDRAATLRRSTANLVQNEEIEPRWTDDGRFLWYRRESGAGRVEYVRVDCATGAKAPLFDPRALARAFLESAGVVVDPERLPIRLVGVQDGECVLVMSEGLTAFAYDDEDGTVRSIPLREADSLRLWSRRNLPASRNGGGRTEILFANGLDDRVSIYWIDTNGEQRDYGELGPGETRIQDTRVGHSWLVVDERGGDRGHYVAEDVARFVLIDGRRWRRRRGGGRREPDGRVEAPPRPERRNRELRVSLREHDVWLEDRATGEELALTTSGVERDAFVGRPEWSPTGSHFVVHRRTPPDIRQVHRIEAAPRDRLQPRLLTDDYLKPGDRVGLDWPHLFDADGRREIPLDRSLFENPYQLRDGRWSWDGERFLFLYNQRGHQVVRVLSIEAATGEVRTLIEERSETFVDYSQKLEYHFLRETDELLWTSERDGWNHLYLFDARTGELVRQLTQGPFVVRRVDRLDAAAREVRLEVSGLDPDQDPYHVHYVRVNLDSGELVRLTEGDGTHRLLDSPDRETYVDRYSRVDLAPVTELRRASDGSLLCELERADWSDLLATGWRPPRRFVAKGRDGETDIWGILRYPTNHDPDASYPVIEEIYAGPHGAHVPKAFHVYSYPSELAELGFVVAQIDGMGTNWRSKSFHDVCWKNLADSGFPDRIAWLRAAAAEDPSLDLSRVGIYGGSAGGQSALRALIAHSDFYRAASADCGCHDNRMDKIWWNEAWMGWPIGEHYEEQSNVTQAHRMEGALLLMVGALDTNVDPSSTMQVVQALIDADKDFELIVFPRGGHGVGSSDYGRRRQADFFVRELLGREPRWQ